MNSTENHDKNNDYKRVEVEVDPEPTFASEQLSSSEQLTQTLTQVQSWFNNLPVPARVAVGIVTVMVVFTILKIFLQLVYALLSVTILGIVLYVLYRFLINSQVVKKN